MTLRIESSIISIDGNITDSIIRKVINVYRRSVGPRMESWGIPALTGYSCEDLPSKTTQNHLLLRKEEIRSNIWPDLRLRFLKKAGMLNSVESLGYIKCYSSSIPRPVKSPGNSIRYNCKKICSWSRRPKTIPEIRKKATYLQVINNCIIYAFQRLY